MAQYKTFSNMAKDENTSDTSNVEEVPRIRTVQQRQAVIDNNVLVVIDYYTDWCGPCKQCGPQFAKLANMFSKPGICAFVKENVDDDIGYLTVKVRGVPCFHIYLNKNLLSEHIIIGADMGVLEQTVKNLLGKSSKN
jgi:thioredoxin 1